MTSLTLRSFNWPHAVASLLVAVTAVLLCFGALVTTFDAAMAVPDWPATYGHNMFLFPWAEWFYGPWDLFLEHGHRLLGAAVGLISLVLAAVVWRSRLSPAVRALAAAAVLLVVVQGALGGARVLLDDKTVAKVHACTGPLFFAVAVAIATLTKTRIARASVSEASVSEASGVGAGCEAGVSRAATRAASGLLIGSYVQLVAGAQLRHLDATIDPTTFRWLVAFHLLGAAAVAALALAAVFCSRSSSVPAVRIWSLSIVLLVACQIMLGFAAWIVNWGLPSDWLPATWTFSDPLMARSVWGATVVTGHVFLGMMILGGSVVLSLATGVLHSGHPGHSGYPGHSGRTGRFSAERGGDKAFA
jgi:cytochrome c oxidase assembly protein subunit 15